MSIPENLKYTKTHEWISLEGETAKVGVTDYAQHEISDVVFVELPAVGKDLEKEKASAVVESVKAAFDIYAPVSGEVLSVNSELESNPGLVNQEAYGTGWFYEIKVTDASQLDSLMDSSQYAEHIKAAH